MRGSVVVVAGWLYATAAAAQPAPEPAPAPAPAPTDQPPPKPYSGKVRDINDPGPHKISKQVLREHDRRPEGPFVEPPFRYAFGGGLSGTVIEHRNLETTFGLEATAASRVNEVVSIGFHAGLSLRNWQQMGNFYSDLVDEKPDESIVYGYLFGWLAGTGMLSIGPEVTLGRATPSRPWVSFGTSLFLFIDGNDSKLDGGVVVGHAGKLSFGYDFSRDFGIGFHVLWAPSDGLTIFGTNGASILQAMLTIEVRGDHRTKKTTK